MTATERIKILRSRDFAHGTRAAYKGGCKCLLCRAANSRYNTAREAARKHGDTRDLVSAEPVVRHLRKLAARGVGYKSVAAAADRKSVV